MHYLCCNRVQLPHIKMNEQKMHCTQTAQESHRNASTSAFYEEVSKNVDKGLTVDIAYLDFGEHLTHTLAVCGKLSLKA